MSLSEISEKGLSLRLVLLQTPSDNLRMFVQDTLKAITGGNQDSIFEVKDKKSLKEALDLCLIKPFEVKKWLFLVDLDKISLVNLTRGMETNSSGIFFCTTSKYSNYKKLKTLNKDLEGFLDIYVSFLRKNDFLYLYDSFVPIEGKLTSALYDFVCKGYSGDVDSVMTLFRALQSGEKVESKRDITDICGLGGNTVDSFILGLLKSEPKTEKGLSTILSNKLKLATDLEEVLGWSKFWGYSLNTVKALCDIKMLYISGAVYKSIRKLPEGYDEKRLSRYNRYLWKLNEIPLSKLLQVRVLLENRRWTTNLDFASFLYKFYKKVALESLRAGTSA